MSPRARRWPISTRTSYSQSLANFRRQSSMQLVDRARAALQKVSPEDVDFKRYMHREEKARVIPAESLAETGKARMLLGVEAEPGLSLPWSKTDGKVLIAPGKLALWAGWTHHGKSQMLKQVMLHAMANDERVCLASMEE